MYCRCGGCWLLGKSDVVLDFSDLSANSSLGCVHLEIQCSKESTRKTKVIVYEYAFHTHAIFLRYGIKQSNK